MDLNKGVKTLLIKEPFYRLFLLNVNRYYSDEIETAAVTIKGINPVLIVNQTFFESLSDDEAVAVLMHEISHIIYKHLIYCSEYDNKTKFNYAADCEVNSAIPILQKDPYIYPSVYGFENFKGTKWYYDNLPNNIPNELVDNHNIWKDGISDATKKLVSNQIDGAVKNTVNQVKKACGNIPGQFKTYIDELFTIKEQVFNWKAYFKRIVGNIITSEIKLTKMRPSRRFPDSRGVISKRKSSILGGVDTSGSINNEELLDFFSEIYHIWKSGVDVTIAEIDTRIHKIYQYKGKFDGEINGRGGTNMDELFKYYLDNKNIYSSLILFTDGFFNIHTFNVRSLVWVLTSNHEIKKYPGIVIEIPNKNE